ncbi:hypothetical protein B0T20DRAFT_248068 [Sordaria brevicollis]|uniref:Uncharacterized protein n=1 Tax=Sordaria brevicollis TaxID=83679 RepID=A0AAE0PBT4_SORBR|nr:hypothetical protein B0T20DRAFT_248068 [Sordaria brevicollis]
MLDMPLCRLLPLPSSGTLQLYQPLTFVLVVFIFFSSPPVRSSHHHIPSSERPIPSTLITSHPLSPSCSATISLKNFRSYALVLCRYAGQYLALASLGRAS